VCGQQHDPATLYPRERTGTHFTGGRVGPRAGLDGRKFRPHRDSIPGCPVIIIIIIMIRKNLETIPGNHSIDSLKKTAILGTSHTIRKVLQCEARGLSGVDHRWLKRSIIY